MRVRAAILILSLLVPATASAHWKTQTIALQPGWNAVYLEVDPEPREIDAALQGIPVQSVWAWAPSYTTVQYIQDPDTLIAQQSDWLSYFPVGSPNEASTNLFTLRGGRGYLIRLGGTSAVNWQVTGEPVAQATRWVGNSYNLVGFAVDAASPPTFATYFAPSAAHVPTLVYQLNRAVTPAQWQSIPATTAIVPGEAYWVFSEAVSEYAGPLEVNPEQAGGLDFGRVLDEQKIRFKNTTAATTQVTLTPQAAAATPPGETAPSGPVLLSYWDGALVPGSWVNLTGSLQVPVPAGKEVEVRLAVRRAEMPGAEYASLLQVKGTGVGVTVPLSARGLGSMQGGAPLGIAAPQSGSDPRAGLWIGTAAVNKVTNTAAGETTATATASEMGIRLIVHVDGNGQAKLLQHVTLMWKDGTYAPDGTVQTPGRLVLVSRDELLGNFEGAAIRDGKQIGRRFSAAAFGFEQPVALTGAFDGTLSGTVVLDYDDPVNPFKHRYHPDHDNLDGDFANVLVEGKESYDVTRSVTLGFAATDPEGVRLAGFGDSRAGGTYAETIVGLHRDPITVGGTFRLTQVSRVHLLDDGL